MANPDAGGAGADCTVSMCNHKRTVYALHLDELRYGGIQYAPMIWSAYGRPHPDALRVLLTLARGAARRRGEASFRSLARRWSAKIAAAIWRRGANMVLACWPVPAYLDAGSLDPVPQPPP